MAVAALERRLREALADEDRPSGDPWSGAALRLCRALGLVSPRGRRLTLAVAAAHYAASDWESLRQELRSRLAAWPSQEADDEARIGRPSRLALARFLIPAAEVVAEIRSRLAVSRGAGRPVRDERGLADGEARRALAAMPEYEREIALGLLRGDAVYWAPPGLGDAEGGTADDLVERPAGTVVLVVRPPGSDWELELKRAGMARMAANGHFQPLSIVATPVPSHRLAGGSSVAALVWEADAAAGFAAAYRRVAGDDPALSRTLGLRTVLKVPVRPEEGARGEAFLLDYFTEPRLFGDGYRAMRAAIAANLAAFEREEGAAPEILPGAVGATTAFLQLMAPAQALLAGTSAHRLDRLTARFAEGTREGFAPQAAPADGARRAETADLLALALDGFSPPAGAGEDLAGATLAPPASRHRAEAIYRRLLEQLGRVWGTLLGLGGHSQGESFVGRNVGLRRQWQNGRPRVELVFMDHDNLYLPPPGGICPDLRSSLAGALKDELAIRGGALRGRYLEGLLELLERIYRIDLLGRDAGRVRLEAALVEAYRQARTALHQDEALARLFPPGLAAHLDQRDAAIAASLAGEKVEESVAAIIEPYLPFLRRHAGLFACWEGTGFPPSRE